MSTSANTATASLPGIPVELKQRIGDFCTRPSLCSLSRTSKLFTEVFAAQLYRTMDVQLHPIPSLSWLSCSMATGRIVDDYMDSVTRAIVGGIAQHGKHVKHLRVRTVSNTQDTQSLVLWRIQCALANATSQPLRSCRIDHPYYHHQNYADGPGFAIRPPAQSEEDTKHGSSWLPLAGLEGLRTERYILCTDEGSQMYKSTVMVMPCPAEPTPQLTENRSFFTFLARAQNPIMIGHLPEEPGSRSLKNWKDWTSGEHYENAWTCVETWLDCVRETAGLESVADLSEAQVQRITFIGSAEREEGNSAEFAKVIKRMLEENGLSTLTDCFAFDEWSEHPDLAHNLGVVLPPARAVSTDTVTLSDEIRL